MTDRYLIVADGFTGANAPGVQLRRRGHATGMIFAGGRIPSAGSVVIDTESRGMTGAEAGEAVSRALADVDFDVYKYVIKKVDSTLRGNVAEEIWAADRACGSELVIFAPAFPDLDRTTVNGVHMLKGVPITQTERARDPKKPVTEDCLSALLAQVYEEPVVHLSLEEVRSGAVDLTRGRLYTADAERNSDLLAVIRAAKNTGKKVLWVGTAAMADNLLELEEPILPALGVAASVSAVTCGQIKAAEKAGVELVQVRIHRILSGEEEPSVCVDAAVERLLTGKDTILLSSSTYDREELELSAAEGRRQGMEPSQVSEYVQTLMGQLTRKILERAQVSGVFLTGGDTAMGVLSASLAEGSEILGEIAVGIPMMRIVGGTMDGLKTVTKAGAFGKEDVLVFALRKLKEQ